MQVKMFKTPMCGVCPQQEEILEDVVADRDDVEMEIIDATEQTDEANRYGVRSAPVTIVEDDGVVEGQFAGLTEADQIETAL